MSLITTLQIRNFDPLLSLNPQQLELLIRRTLYRYNCQETIFSKNNVYSNKEAENGKYKNKLRKFWRWKVQLRKITITIKYISFKTLLTESGTWHIHTTSNYLRSYKPSFASNLQNYTALALHMHVTNSS